MSVERKCEVDEGELQLEASSLNLRFQQRRASFLQAETYA